MSRFRTRRCGGFDLNACHTPDCGDGVCKTRFEGLSEEHLQAAVDRLEAMNGVLKGPACKGCGRKDRDAPEEVLRDGAEVPRPNAKNKGAGTPGRLRSLHKPCCGTPAARISATLDPKRPRQTAHKAAILRAGERRRDLKAAAPDGPGAGASLRRGARLRPDLLA